MSVGTRIALFDAGGFVAETAGHVVVDSDSHIVGYSVLLFFILGSFKVGLSLIVKPKHFVYVHMYALIYMYI